MRENLKIGLFGFGCVGGGLYEILNKSNLLDASIKKICIKDPSKDRSIDSSNFTTNKSELLEDDEINLIVELIDDADAAYDIVVEAFKKGKNVVSANKKLIANHFAELKELSEEYGVSFIYEAAVCGSIPILRNLEEYYNNDAISAVNGICNGTTNYILTRLVNENKSFDEVLKNAQELGFAESDPTLDIEGFDSQFKLQILIAHAFGVIVKPEDILRFGITKIQESDIKFAKEKGLRIRLLSRAEKVDSTITGLVAPHFVDEDDATYGVNNEFNAVTVKGLFADKQLFQGKGAGSYPTGSAVLSDVSAVRYNYKYEWRKIKHNSLEFNNYYAVKAYISTTEFLALDGIEFLSVEESFIGLDNSYKVGLITREELARIAESKANVSVVLFQDPIHDGKELNQKLINIQKN